VPPPLGEVRFGDVTELFAQPVGAGETEVTDLVQATGAGLRPERCATSSARIASTFPSAVFAIPDARPDSAARAASIASTGSDLPHAADLTVGAINLDHDQPTRLEVAREARAIGAGALDTDASDRTERAQPVVQQDEPDSGTVRERLDTEQSAVRVERGGDMIVEVGVDSTRDRARRIYDGHCHPFSLNRLRGGTHVP
jgi:hypothetical protein